MRVDCRIIIAVVCLIAIAAQSCMGSKCGSANWGRKAADAQVHKTGTLQAGQTLTAVRVPSQLIGCRLVGVEAIACDPYEEPSVSFIDNTNVIVRRTYGTSSGSLVFITFCEPLYHPTGYIPWHL